MIAFAGGGTGGHIYPALAVIAALREHSGFEFFWIGRRAGVDRTIVEAAGIRFFGIKAGKLRRYFSLKNISDIVNIIAGFFESRVIFKREKPAMLFSKGGFVSVPPALAAASLGITVHTHESDFSAGLATRINARAASVIWTAYEESSRYFSPSLRKKLRVAGNPVRPAFRAASAERGRLYIEGLTGYPLVKDRKILLVLGGSQGAQEINSLVEASRAKLCDVFFVVHQTGAAQSGCAGGKNYLPVAYIYDEMPDILAAASLVLGRSGAGTLWEAAAAGTPMALVPLAGSGTRGDQVENARYFEAKGAAAALIHPKPEELTAMLLDLAADEKRLSEMAAAARRIGETDAAGIIAAGIVKAVSGSGGNGGGF